MTRTRTRTPLSPASLLHPVWLVALVALAVNDHLLKGAGLLPGWLTGKLSDLAGLLVAPLLLAVLCRVRTRGGLAMAHLVVAVGFTAIQISPATAALYDALVTTMGIAAHTWSDPTDLIALLMLWPSWRIADAALAAGRCGSRRRPLARRVLALAAATTGALVCMATPAEESALPPEEDTSVPQDVAAPFCGDGVVDGGEACDDGNDVAEDGCTQCLLDPVACLDDTHWVGWSCDTVASSTVCEQYDCQLGEAGVCAVAPELLLSTQVVGRVTAGDPTPTVAVDPVGASCACRGIDAAGCDATACAQRLGPCQTHLLPMTLTVDAPPEGMEFLGWSGDCTGSATTCTPPTGFAARAVARFSAPSTVAWAGVMARGTIELVAEAPRPDGGRILLTRYDGQVQFGDATFDESSSVMGSLLVALDDDGAVAWSRAIDDPQVGTLEAVDVAVDPSTGQVAVVGVLEGELRHGDDALSLPLSHAPTVDYARGDSQVVVTARDATPVMLTWDAQGLPRWMKPVYDAWPSGPVTRALHVAHDASAGHWLVAATSLDPSTRLDESILVVVAADGTVVERAALNAPAVDVTSASVLVRALTAVDGVAVLTVVVTGDPASAPLLGERETAWDDDVVLLELELTQAEAVTRRADVLVTGSMRVAAPLQTWPLTVAGDGRRVLLVADETRQQLAGDRQLATLWVAPTDEAARAAATLEDGEDQALLVAADGSLVVGTTVRDAEGVYVALGRWSSADELQWSEQLPGGAAGALGALSESAVDGRIAVLVEAPLGWSLGDETLESAGMVELTVAP